MQAPAAQAGTSSDAAAQGTSPDAAAQEAAAESAAAQDGGIPQLRFVRGAGWVKVEVIDSVTGGCFLQADEALEHATAQLEELGLETTGDETVFHVIFRVRTTGQRTPQGECFGAIFFEELYPVDVVVQPGAEPYRSRWQGRLGLQKLIITEGPFDSDVFTVIDDGVRMLFRER